MKPDTYINILLSPTCMITLLDLPQNRHKKTVLEEVLSVQVPDAKVLALCNEDGTPLFLESGAFERLGLSPMNRSAIPDVVAYSDRNTTLFLIDAMLTANTFDGVRAAAYKGWSQNAFCKVVRVMVFASRTAFLAQLYDSTADAHIWFADEPARSISTSTSSEEAVAVFRQRVAFSV